MPGTRHVVRLTAAERAEPRALVAAGTAPARTQTHARILLKCDLGAGGPRWTDARVAEAVEVSARTVARARGRLRGAHGRHLARLGPAGRPTPAAGLLRRDAQGVARRRRAAAAARPWPPRALRSRVRALVDGPFADAACVVLVSDTLNTHDPASLDKTFPPAEAARIWSRLELHFTPTHGSWLNLAEIALSALARQCLARRIPDADTLAREVAAWAAARNQDGVRIEWRFSVEDAHRALTHLYPIPDDAT